MAPVLCFSETGDTNVLRKLFDPGTTHYNTRITRKNSKKLTYLSPELKNRVFWLWKRSVHNLVRKVFELSEKTIFSSFCDGRFLLKNGYLLFKNDKKSFFGKLK